MLLGLAAALLASLFYGCTFVPIKRVYAGDGFTSQLFACIGVFSACMIISAAQGFSNFYPFAMIGGFLWSIANAFAIQILNRLGLGLGNLVWNTLSTLTGWATSRYFRFGLFGLTASIPASPGLNFLGVAVLIGGGAMYSMVKNNAQRRPGHEGDAGSKEACSTEENAKESKIQDISLIERALSLLAAMVSGLFYGTMWLPVNYMMAHPGKFPDTPNRPLPYMFSYGCGVLCTAICVFLVYAIKRRNHPWVSGETAIPAFATGSINACGMASFGVAIDKLNATIAYPICQMAPGLVAALWGVLYFKEISGRRNLLLLISAYLVTVVGVALVTISREVEWF